MDEQELLRERIVNIVIDAMQRDAEADYESTNESEAGTIADALIAANISDVTGWRERAEKAEERLKNLKRTDGDLTIEDEINVIESFASDAKRRALIFEKKLVEERKELKKWKKRAEIAEFKLLRSTNIFKDVMWDAYALGQQSRPRLLRDTADALDEIVSKTFKKVEQEFEEEDE